MEKSARMKELVRQRYSQIVKRDSCSCSPSCCGGERTEAAETAKMLGYREEDLSSAPEGAYMGLGCGNPLALASLRKGETVLDLGSGAGFDCFLAAKEVGSSGRVIGIDMTAEMVEKARQNASRGGYRNVEFRLGDIESLPVADGSVDVVISNCVINLAPDKEKVFREAFRTLRPGGRLWVSDLVLLRELPEAVINSVEAYVGCISGAAMRDEYLRMIERAGFQEVRIVEEVEYPVQDVLDDPAARTACESLDLSAVASVKVHAAKSL